MANQDPGSSPIGDDVVEAVNEAHGRAVRAILRPQAQVDRLTPRHVMRFISTHNVGPDLELELLVLKT